MIELLLPYGFDTLEYSVAKKRQHVVSGKSKLMRVGLCTEILRLRVLMDGILF
jgi:hypothetical protein